MARRTHDESGDYIVDTFDLDVRTFQNQLQRVTNSNSCLYTEQVEMNLCSRSARPGSRMCRGYSTNTCYY
jgi:hypothetical protein